jgi:predicted DNA-binding transcriptional regulator AlpA
MNTTDQILTTKQAAKILGIDKRTLDNWRSLSRGPAYLKQSKRLVRYLYSDVLAFRDTKRIEPVNN